MSLVCKDGISPCSGCGTCLEHTDICDLCKRKMELGERYYRFFKKTVCKECAFSPVGGKCILCRKPATDVLKYKDVVLCRSCSRTATGYVGYI